VFFPATPGIYADDATVRLSGANTSVVGGSASVPAINIGPAGATVEVDPLVAINGSVNGGTVATTDIPASATVGGSSGNTIAVTTYSEPGSFAFSFVALPLPRTPTPFGELWMTPPVVTVTAGVVPANGELAGSFVVPAGAQGASLAFQPAAILSNGSIVLGLPTVAIYR
ncbi:MAG: hypothetical protein KAI24_19670, partial [Planctomycetes bacterium]|nr:hypothetical protein [Planctomycetota bacterium]